jgi:peptide/nickel transport system substrate-binding protein
MARPFGVTPRTTALASLVVALPLALTGCGSSSSSGSGPGSSGSVPTLSIAIPTEPASMDVMREIASPLTEQIAPNVVQSLAVLDLSKPGDKQVQPSLATSWKEDNPKQWTVKIRSGVKFSNGETMTAKDVVASVEYGIQSAAASYYQGYYPTVASAKEVNSTTVTFKMNTPDPDFPRRLAYIEVMPADTLDPTTMKTHFVGSGPYELSAWNRGQNIILKPNPNYSGPDTAAYSTVTFLIRPDEGVRASAVSSGEADLATGMQVTDKSRVPQLISGPGMEVAGYVLNDANQKAGGSVMADVRVRQAVNYAIDRNAIIKSIYGGQAQLPKCQWNPTSFSGTDPNLSDYPYDPTKAKQLIDAAGAQGKTVQITTVVNFWTGASELSQAVGNYLSAVGLNVKYQSVELTPWLTYYQNSQAGKDVPFDMTTVYHGNDFFDSTIKTFDLLKSIKAGGGNFLVNSPQLDSQIASAQAETDPTTRVQDAQAAWKTFCSQALSMPVAVPNAIYAAASGVKFTPEENTNIVIKDIVKQ